MVALPKDEISIWCDAVRVNEIAKRSRYQLAHDVGSGAQHAPSDVLNHTQNGLTFDVNVFLGRAVRYQRYVLRAVTSWPLDKDQRA